MNSRFQQGKVSFTTKKLSQDENKSEDAQKSYPDAQTITNSHRSFKSRRPPQVRILVPNA